MESKGWIFSWNDQYVFRPEQQKTFCSDVPLTSYCGFQFPGDGEISYKFSSSGTANLTYGNSMNGGWIRIYLNNKEISSRNPKGTSNVKFDYSEGDVLSIRETHNSIINIHSLCGISTGSYLELLIIRNNDYKYNKVSLSHNLGQICIFL